MGKASSEELMRIANQFADLELNPNGAVLKPNSMMYDIVGEGERQAIREFLGIEPSGWALSIPRKDSEGRELSDEKVTELLNLIRSFRNFSAEAVTEYKKRKDVHEEFVKEQDFTPQQRWMFEKFQTDENMLGWPEDLLARIVDEAQKLEGEKISVTVARWVKSQPDITE